MADVANTLHFWDKMETTTTCMAHAQGHARKITRPQHPPTLLQQLQLHQSTPALLPLQLHLAPLIRGRACLNASSAWLKQWITDALNGVIEKHTNHDIHRISTPLQCAGDALKNSKSAWYYVLEVMADQYCRLHDTKDVKNNFDMKSTSIAIRAPIPEAENRVLQVYTTTFEYKVGERDRRFTRSKVHQIVSVIFRVILSRGNDIFLYFSESAVEEKGSFAKDLDDRNKIPLKTVSENPHTAPRKHPTVKILPPYKGSTTVQLADAAMHDTTSTEEACEHKQRKMQAASKQNKNTCKAQQPDQQPEGPMKDKQQEYHTIFM
jgi:hypothetical protein